MLRRAFRRHEARLRRGGGAGAGGGGGGGGSITSGWHYADTKNVDANGTEKAFNNFVVGGASASRVVVACVVWSHSLGSTISTITIGGVSGTLVQAQAAYSVHGRCAMYYAVVPTGTTADVVVTLSTTTNAGAQCSVYFGFPVTSTPLDSGSANVAGGALVTVSNIEIATGGILIGFTGSSSTATSYAMTWSGADALTQDNESVVNLTSQSSRHLVATESDATFDMTSDPAGASASALIAASWGA